MQSWRRLAKISSRETSTEPLGLMRPKQARAEIQKTLELETRECSNDVVCLIASPPGELTKGLGGTLRPFQQPP